MTKARESKLRRVNYKAKKLNVTKGRIIYEKVEMRYAILSDYS